MKQFEYTIKYNPPSRATLAKMGEEGWELCAVDTGSVIGSRYIFKRELTQTAE